MPRPTPSPQDFLVLGAGFIGTSFARSLRVTGHRVMVVTRRAQVPGTGPNLLHLGVDDLPESITARVVIHCRGAAVPRLAAVDLPATARESLASIDESLAIARRVGAERVFLVSSGGAIYGASIDQPAPSESTVPEPTTAYGRLKLLEEQYLAGLAGDGPESIAVRFTNVYGSLQSVDRQQGLIPLAIHRVTAGEPVQLFAHLDTERDYLHVDDAAAAIARLAEIDLLPGVVNVGSGRATRTRDVLALVGSAVGRAPNVEQVGRVPDPDSGAVDIARLRSLIPWAPRSLPDGIGSVVAEMTERHD